MKWIQERQKYTIGPLVKKNSDELLNKNVENITDMFYMEKIEDEAIEANLKSKIE